MPLAGRIHTPELFIGLVGAIGTNLDLVSKELTKSLANIAYNSKEIHVIELIHQIDPWTDLPEKDPVARYRQHMDAGNEIRRHRRDALAGLAVGEVRRLRKDHSRKKDPDATIASCAYIFRSLKHPDEVYALRRVYGPGFLLVAAYCPREARLTNLAKKIAAYYHKAKFENYMSQAQELNNRDEQEPELEFGQNVRHTFPMADVFIDATDDSRIRPSVDRFIELLFGHPHRTPTPSEYGMFHAQAAAYRSGSLSRQVGVAITDGYGEIVALGSNDVPKAGGGLYWPGPDDKRDWQRGYDVSDRMKKDSLAEILQRLTKEWLAPEKRDMSPDDRLRAALNLMRGTQLMRAIEYGRSVHAEMCALLDAARRGVSVRDSSLYTTTFPCHDCARHIVAAGISRVVYIEPYAKSLAAEFHEDSIAVDTTSPGDPRVKFEPFVGIGPRIYMEVFAFADNQRKDKDGRIIEWRGPESLPRLLGSSPTYLRNEKEFLALVSAAIARNN